MDLSSKADAKQFLKRLERFLNAGLPSAAAMAEDVESVVKQAKTSSDQRHMAFPEGAVLNRYILPLVGRFLREEVGLEDENARQALLSESCKALPSLASRSPARSAKHPFSKAIGIKPKQVVEQWKGKSGLPALARSCPDLALREPAPHRVVFEAKYFRQGGLPRAESELVTGIYQAFFYRGLPSFIEKPPRPSWNYDYACLLICDGSPDGNVVTAWTSLDPQVRTACWEGANIYVMVLRGPDRAASSRDVTAVGKPL
jgi:hypothetical protein